MSDDSGLDLGQVVSGIGGAVGSLFTSKGNAAEANSYLSAAALDEQNAQLSNASTRIQETQTARAVTQSLGTTQADVAGAGFTESGSALDLLKSSAQQGSLATSLVNIQGAINENAYAAEAGANMSKAKAANEAQTAGTIGAIASIGGALLSGGTSLAKTASNVVSGGKYVYNSLFGPNDPLASAAGIDQSSAVWVNSAGDSVAAGTPGAVQLTPEQASQFAGEQFTSGNALTAQETEGYFQSAGGGFAPAGEPLSFTDQTISQGASLDSSSGIIGLTPNTVLPEGATSDAVGTITLADGTVFAPGTTIAADGTVTAADGSLVAADASAIPEGASIAADGTVTAADGTIFEAGTTFAEDGSILAADGSVIAADASVIPAGFTIAADGTILDATGAAFDAGTAIAADGTLVDAGGAAILDAGGSAIAADAGAASGIGDVLSSIGDALSFTVLCTALYGQGLIPRKLWVATKRYGMQSNPRTFAGYLLWASPIARMVTKHRWFARLVAPIFIPPLKEEAVRVGLEVERTIYGRLSFVALYGLSWILGWVAASQYKSKIIIT